MFDFLRPRKKTNFQLLFWSLYISTVVTLTAKILQLSSDLTIQILAQHPELAQYSTMVKLYVIFS
nr:hypothetical protein [Candidatus Gracilibacteria bacterium]